MEASKNLLTGDVLLASSFISYAGPFTKSFRDILMQEKFFAYLIKSFNGGAEAPAEGAPEMPMSPTFDPISILTTGGDRRAETTLINFTVTQAGLSDQLLTLVVQKERGDLAELAESLIKQQNGFKIKMKELGFHLGELANAEGDITEDVDLIEGLEETKRISIDINKKSAIANETQANIRITSNKYKSVADRSSQLFFLMNDLAKIHSYYVYSLAAFTKVFYRGIDLVTAKKAVEVNEDGEEVPPEEEAEVVELNDEELAARCVVLMNSITLTTFNYIRRGLFEKDKLTIATMVTLRIAVSDEAPFNMPAAYDEASSQTPVFFCSSGVDPTLESRTSARS
ncbi:hypothetical protein JL722_14956 [Aureococcus anophagefferens]|nr:hypothetical protein JL722_14956 [Aureococcus anophagefferens]